MAAVHNPNTTEFTNQPGAGAVVNEKGGVTGQPLTRGVTPGGHPYEALQPAFPSFHRKFANPAPLGLFGFATTTLILSLYNAHARHITIPNVVVGMALGYGGLAQFIAGVWEFAAGNTFGATAFCSYGAFWFSYAAILWPSSGIIAAYSSADAQLESALGIYLLAWFVVTFLFWIASLRSSVALSAVFFFLFITFILLGAGALRSSVSVSKAGGWFGIITALIAFYVGMAGLLTPDTSYFLLPIGPLGPKN